MVMCPRHSPDSAVGLRRAEVPHGHIAVFGLAAFHGIEGTALVVRGVDFAVAIADQMNVGRKVNVVLTFLQLTVEQHDTAKGVRGNREYTVIRPMIHRHFNVDDLVNRLGNQVIVLMDNLLSRLYVGQNDFSMSFHH